jgi:hypothetical protein
MKMGALRKTAREAGVAEGDLDDGPAPPGAFKRPQRFQ